MLFHPDETNMLSDTQAYNCLMYAIMQNYRNPKEVFEVFQKRFLSNGGDGTSAFRETCAKLGIAFREVKNLNAANLAVASFMRVTGYDYEHLPEGYAPDYHFIRKTKSGWFEKNRCFQRCDPTPVPQKELIQWQNGSQDIKIGYFLV